MALRALLSYFSTKDILSLPASKVELHKVEKTEKTQNNYLKLEELEKLLNLPNIKTKSGLRDQVILEILVSTGLKVRQLINLNRDQIETDYKGFYFSKEVLPCIEKYLNTREDKNKALFINYRSKKHADKRLTIRSVERIVNHYGKLLNIPFSLTPETLRWARAISLLEEEKYPKAIKKPCTHLSCLIKNYNYNSNKNKNPKNNLEENSSWHSIETIINQEITWLQKNISTLPEKYRVNLFPVSLNCDDCILRKIAILIVSNKIKATQFQSKKRKNIWINSISVTEKLDLTEISYHGKEWHRNMMDIIYRYFKKQNYEAILEPTLNYGRADIGIYISSKQTIYVEVGTVSLYKLWFNLSTMKNATFLIVSSEDKIIELKV